MSTIALAALLVHHCVDEDGYVTLELHAPMIRSMALAAKQEHDSLRAENAELLAALKELVDAHAEMNAAVEEGSPMPFQPVLHRYTAAWAAARAAIKRAEGREGE